MISYCILIVSLRIDLLPAASSLFRYGGAQYLEAINSFTADGVPRRRRRESSSSTAGDFPCETPVSLVRFLDVLGVAGVTVRVLVFGFLDGPASAFRRLGAIDLIAFSRSACSGTLLLSSSDDPDAFEEAGLLSLTVVVVFPPPLLST